MLTMLIPKWLAKIPTMKKEAPELPFELLKLLWKLASLIIHLQI